MLVKNKKTFTDKSGLKSERIDEKGIIERVLITPSSWYIDNVQKPLIQKAKKREKQAKRDIKIQLKMREIAIREIEREEKPD